MPLSASNLEEKYYDIYNSYQEIVNAYKIKYIINRPSYER